MRSPLRRRTRQSERVRLAIGSRRSPTRRTRVVLPRGRAVVACPCGASGVRLVGDPGETPKCIPCRRRELEGRCDQLIEELRRRGPNPDQYLDELAAVRRELLELHALEG